MRRLTRMLLAFYPARFRRRHGPEALAVLREDLADAGARGPVAGLFHRGLLLAEFALDGLRERVRVAGAAAGAAAAAVAGGDGFWYGWTHDVRHALRSTSRRAGFTLVAVLSLAVGIGANAVVFAVVDTFFLRDIPGVTDPDRIVELQLTYGNGNWNPWPYPDFVDVSEQVGGLASTALYEQGPVNLSFPDGGQRLMAQYVTSGYFQVMGLTPSRGRDFGPEVDRGPGEHPVAILSHRTWSERFAGDPGIVGRTVEINRTAHTVLGVAPEAFEGHQFGVQPDLWLPMTQYPPVVRNPEVYLESRGTQWADVMARLGPEASLDEVNAALGTVLTRLDREYRDGEENRTAVAHPAALLPAGARQVASFFFGLLAGLMLLVLAATSANVGGMLLARAASRRREMAVRMALGSGRARVVRHLFTESLVIFLLGGGTGVWLAVQGIQWFEAASALPTFLPVRLDFALNWRIVGFALALTGGVGLLFGLVPALATTRREVAAGIRNGGDREGMRTSGLRKVFVAGQVGVAVLLLAFSGLFLKALEAGRQIELGLEPREVYATGLDLNLEGYGDPAEATVFLDRLLEEIQALPGAGGAALASDLPLDGRTSSAPAWPDGEAAGRESVQSDYAHVSPGYFETLGIPVLAGRTIQREDDAGAPPVVVINQALAETGWPGESALGRTLSLGSLGGDPVSYTVVGVVGNTSSGMATDALRAGVFTALAQNPASEVQFAVRREVPDPDFVRRMRDAMLAVDPGLALSRTIPLEDLAAMATLPHRVVAGVASVLGLLALFLSALGVYGIVAFTVTARTREIGVRIALGSSRREVLRQVLVDGLRLALPGLLLGLPLAVAVSFAFRGLLLGVSPLDPMAYLAVAGIFLAVVCVASFVPARRASAVEPVEALRAE